MKRLDSIGRITLPKEMRERNGFKTDDLFEIYERGDEVVLKPLRTNYSVSETQMHIFRKLYNVVKDTDILDESELIMLKEACKITDALCPKCNEPLYLTSDNAYKCMNCGD